MRWVAEVKYLSNATLLMVMVPAPGRKRTRATACLRRPVVWLSGAGMWSFRCVVACVVSGSAGPAGLRQLERLRLLGGVRVVGAGVDLELAQHLAAEGVLGQHAAHRTAHQLGRLLGQQLLVGGRAQA